MFYGWQICSSTHIVQEVCSLSWSDTLATRAVVIKSGCSECMTQAINISFTLGLFKISDYMESTVVPTFQRLYHLYMFHSFLFLQSDFTKASDLEAIGCYGLEAVRCRYVICVYSDFEQVMLYHHHQH